ncbi:MAG: Na+/H+ antiporter [Chthoniobacterales bacterium]
MYQAEAIVGLFVVVAVLVLIARKLGLPYPIVLVLAGLALSFVPHLPQVTLKPELVFYFLLPPLIYPAALFTSWRDFRRNIRPILLLSTGLILATTILVAWALHTVVPAIPWAAAFAFGAIVSPTDAVAATAVIRRLGLPHRIEVIVEGESLVNDATGLVALQFAVAALMTGRFSLGVAVGQFAWVALGGIAFGLAIGILMRAIQRRLDDPPVQITFSLLTPFAAYLPAEQLHVSGILAVVAAGIFLGWHSPLILRARYRLQSQAIWEMLVFLLNGFVFISIGLQLPAILRALHGESLRMLIGHALLISAATMLVRVGWVFTATYLPRFFFPPLRRWDPYPDWREVVIGAWSGMRGVISLAAAFALPFALPNGAPFPGRNYILFFTFTVILATLVVQGLTLPLLARAIRVGRDTTPEEEERQARVEANKAALQLLDQTESEQRIPSDVVDRLRAEYDERLAQLEACAESADGRCGEIATPQYQQLQYEALQRERETIIRLRNAHVINDDALRHIQRDLDLAEARLAGD